VKCFNIKEVRDIKNYQYVGRNTIFGNPFVIGVDGNRNDVIDKYYDYALNTPKLLSAITKIDKDIVCHCKPKKCHGDVIIEIYNKLKKGIITIPTQHRLAIVGSRSFKNYNLFKSTLENFLFTNDLPFYILISGGAPGVDSLARQYWEEKNINHKEIAAKWNNYGSNAGFIRNTEIVLQSTYILAFWDGYSTGTLDTLEKAKHFNKEFTVIHTKDLK
jgi:hypothetical protein